MRKVMMSLALLGLMMGLGTAQDFDPAAMMKMMRPLMQMMQRSPAALLANKGVQDELKLSEEQRKSVDEKARERMSGGKERMMEMFNKLGELKDVPEDKREAKLIEILKPEMDKANKEASEILKPEQMARLKQIALQVAGNAAFMDPDVAQELSLKEEQVSKIKTITSDLAKDIGELMRAEGGGKGGFGGFGKMSNETREKMTALNKEANEKVQEILTADQKSKWTKMIGDKFELKMDFRPRKQKDD